MQGIMLPNECNPLIQHFKYPARHSNQRSKS